jgi:LPS O-antigen subunit length determinant protein (WzzB/FepE family)
VIEIITVVILLLAAGGSVWYTLRTTGRSQAAVEAAQAATVAAQARIKELEQLRHDQATKQTEADETTAKTITDSAGAADFLRQSFATRKHTD